MGVVVTVTPILWIPHLLAGILGFALTASILQSERRRRRFSNTLFADKYLQFTSAGCLWFGVITTTLVCLNIVPGFCVMKCALLIALSTQFMFLGLYQLARLYSCFSKEMVHSDKGYPLWVFVLMIAVGITLWISGLLLLTAADTLPLKCGYRSGAVLFWEYRDRTLFFDGDPHRDADILFIHNLWYCVTTAAALCLDITTLLLYLWKIWGFRTYKSKRGDIWSGILFVLYRIVILTIFYQMAGVYGGLIVFTLMMSSFTRKLGPISQIVSYAAGPVIMSTLWSLCVYLMMEHNTDQYLVFLRFLRRFRLNFVCFCCCRKMVDRQIDEWSSMKPKIKESDVESTKTLQSNISRYITYSVQAPELSLDTISCEKHSE